MKDVVPCIDCSICGIKSKTASESAIYGMHTLVDEVFEDMYIALLVLDL
ncbi:MAG: hypothetical protein RR572_03065 [Raoultibacter sp.]